MNVDFSKQLLKAKSGIYKTMNKLGRSAQKPKKQSIFQRRLQRHSNNNLDQLHGDGAKAETSSISSI